ncbi:MAG: hypothetical protein IKB09_08550 [Oscillospiraceae bacterium]|nr:hypothetical protein [Oscillospiraceae bacterium]
MNGKYEDILHLPHHVSKKRKQMSSYERAAQFSPFAALTGFETVISECGRLTDAAVELEEDEKNLLNARLEVLYRYQWENPAVTVNYFVPDSRKSGGEFITATGNVLKIDPVGQRLFLTGGTVVKFDRIRWIQSPVFAGQELLFAEL